MILGVNRIRLWAKRIAGCTVQGARTPQGPSKLKSSLRSRRKLRLVWPVIAISPLPVRPRSPLRQTCRDGRECLHNFFPKTLDDREKQTAGSENPGTCRDNSPFGGFLASRNCLAQFGPALDRRRRVSLLDAAPRLVKPFDKPGQAGTERSGWFVAKKAACLGNIRAGKRHVTWLLRQIIDLRLPAKRDFDRKD